MTTYRIEYLGGLDGIIVETGVKDVNTAIHRVEQRYIDRGEDGEMMKIVRESDNKVMTIATVACYVDWDRLG